MSTEVEVARPPAQALSEMTLEQLGAAARDEYQAMGMYLAGALSHAIKLGEILWEAKSRVPPGKWGEYRRSLGFEHNNTVDAALRLAKYQDHLPPEAFAVYKTPKGRVMNPTPTNALRYLAAMPPTDKPRGRPQTDREEAKRLRDSGLTFREIAELMNMSVPTIHGWLDPEFEKKRRASANRRNKITAEERRLARKAKQEAERKALARRVGGDLSYAYAEIRKALAHVDQHLGKSNGTKAAKLRQAIEHLHVAEGAVVAAMQIDRAETAA